MRWKPNVTVAAVVEKQGRFLIVEEEEEEHGLTSFNQPAGHLEKNETLVEAIKREVLEETAWEFAPASLIGTYLYHRADLSYLRFCFAGHCHKHRPEQALDKGIIQTHWLTRAELEARRAHLRSPLVLQCVEDFLGGQAYPLDVLKHDLPPSFPG